MTTAQMLSVSPIKPYISVHTVDMNKIWFYDSFRRTCMNNIDTNIFKDFWYIKGNTGTTPP